MAAATAFLVPACQYVGGDDIDLSLVYDERLGGETTTFSKGSNAFELSARNLTNEERQDI